MKVFLATSFSAQIDADGWVLPEYRRLVEAAIATLEAEGHEVFCAVAEEGWRINDVTPETALEMDRRELGGADMMVALVDGKTVSGGVQLEIGYAWARGQRIVLARAADDKLPYLNIGLVKSGEALEVVYESEDELVAKLGEVLKRVDETPGN